ncbi:chromate resistance protein [Acinetobacter nosocomialis]|uniref:chromate resistance protein ChrB domain-containing protein n=1 Tax=Acinetobacter calcoaceticus/baumannii complex TaxID=909768 RepID=UPI000452F4EB|nr:MULTISPECIES: chromate resistance protein ChrB domain-containing protein [Acinetobacter calcoaceticus/baumannii complex]EKU6034075.1 chromate resistance protein [Acinetobacter nosocomialis]EKU6037470.1 chromate resistance protein [Acinetobacter nosocomialis]EXE70500.1 chromate resistance exported family protein [Acinetobacter sp. 1566109]MBJ9962696.1 chromate resistance protein [Acinetobacter nosocomialis]MBP1478502.1 chromate resistance protein [Acinetobacter nosocomialis]
MNISLLISSLPTQNSTARMRVWRSLKASGAATVRDGVYLLPITHSEKFEAIAQDVISEQGSAYIFQAEAPLNLEIISLFNRNEEYEAIRKQLVDLNQNQNENEKKELLKQVRKLRKSLDALVEIDYFPSEVQEQTLNELISLEHSIARLGETNEPVFTQAKIKRLLKKDYQNQVWATRKHPWIDRLASAWLIKNFIDESPQFLWLESPSECPTYALGYDFDGATFTHIDNLVTFEVLLHSFELETPALKKIAEIVHYLDVGGFEPPEAIGIEKVIQGLRSQISNDDQLFELANYIFDGLYADLKRERS